MGSLWHFGGREGFQGSFRRTGVLCPVRFQTRPLRPVCACQPGPPLRQGPRGGNRGMSQQLIAGPDDRCVSPDASQRSLCSSPGRSRRGSRAAGQPAIRLVGAAQRQPGSGNTHTLPPRPGKKAGRGHRQEDLPDAPRAGLHLTAVPSRARSRDGRRARPDVTPHYLAHLRTAAGAGRAGRAGSRQRPQLLSVCATPGVSPAGGSQSGLRA